MKLRTRMALVTAAALISAGSTYGACGVALAAVIFGDNWSGVIATTLGLMSLRLWSQCNKTFARLYPQFKRNPNE